MSDDYDDAQRVLERKALRNVRGLVDTIEARDLAQPREAAKIALWAVLGAALVAVLAFSGWELRRSWFPPAAARPTADMTTAEYVAQSLAKIERASKVKRLRSEMSGLDGAVDVILGINRNGYVETWEVTRSSFNTALDYSAARVVKFAEPFGALPREVLAKSGGLRFTGTVRIASAGRADPTVTLDGKWGPAP